jgi:hypothetical protein
MEKMSWAALAVLWTSLLAGSAFGADVRDSAEGSQSESAMIASASLVSPVRNMAADRVLRPMVEIGQRGSGELAGAGLLGAAFVFRALRRRGLV